MVVNLPIEQFSDAELATLSRLYARSSEPCPCATCLWVAELSEALRAETARRRIVAAQERDPIGYHLFGRISDGYV